jgi:aminoglycoside/choline kinase family phosphotransferase
MPRDSLIRDWVDQHLAPQFPGQTIQIRIASADASFRSYFRLELPDGSTRILMDAPPEHEDCRPFVRGCELMAAAGLNAPKVLKADFDNGILLLTDLGITGYLDALRHCGEDKTTIRALFDAASDALVKWQLSSAADVLPPYDEALLRRELDLFPEWFVGRHLGHTLTESEQVTLDTTFRLLIDSALAQPKVFVHRDFMPRNLMLCSPEEGGNPGILDFQDAVYGPISYDVVSLFRDAFISWEEEDELDWVIRYWEKARKAGLPVPEDFADFWQSYELMGLQRHLKVLGIFCRLNYRDGKERYISDLPRFINYVRRTANRYIVLKPLLNLMDTLVPVEQSIGFTF